MRSNSATGNPRRGSLFVLHTCLRPTRIHSRPASPVPGVALHPSGLAPLRSFFGWPSSQRSSGSRHSRRHRHSRCAQRRLRLRILSPEPFAMLSTDYRWPFNGCFLTTDENGVYLFRAHYVRPDGPATRQCASGHRQPFTIFRSRGRGTSVTIRGRRPSVRNESHPRRVSRRVSPSRT